MALRLADVDELAKEANPIGDLVRVYRPRVLAKFDGAMALERHKVDLIITAAHNAGQFSDVEGTHKPLERNAGQRPAVGVVRAATARRHDGVDFSFMVGVATHDGLDVVDGQIRGVEMNMEAAAAVDGCPGVRQSLGHGHGFLNAFLAMEHRADDLKTAAHAGILHQLPVGSGRVVVGFILHGDADGPQNGQSGLMVDASNFQFDPKRAVHILQPLGLVSDSPLP